MRYFPAEQPVHGIYNHAYVQAYTLKHEGSSDSHGQECVDTLLKEMENHKDLVVILAGYGKEMAGLLNVNPGIQSRFPNQFNPEDTQIRFQRFKDGVGAR